jgi:hypothetical protein
MNNKIASYSNFGVMIVWLMLGIFTLSDKITVDKFSYFLATIVISSYALDRAIDYAKKDK